MLAARSDSAPVGVSADDLAGRKSPKKKLLAAKGALFKPPATKELESFVGAPTQEAQAAESV